MTASTSTQLITVAGKGEGPSKHQALKLGERNWADASTCRTGMLGDPSTSTTGFGLLTASADTAGAKSSGLNTVTTQLTKERGPITPLSLHATSATLACCFPAP